jgi:23S rRNA pseudouridine1911/1915/1917 synthase
MSYVVFKGYENISIQEFLESFYISKSIIYQIKTNKLLSVNGEDFDFNYRLKNLDGIYIDTSMFDLDRIIGFRTKLDIIYEDDDLLIVNKPVNMLVHGDGKDLKTLNNAVSFYYESLQIDSSVRHCHRLDFETSGIVVYAKHLFSHAYINRQIENGDFKRHYNCLVEGYLEKNNGIIEAKIGKNRHLQNQYLISETGKSATTLYRTIKKHNNKTLLEVELLTGRRHQIRVHLKSIGHPIIGDSIYGELDKRLMLHACKVSFIHPRTKKRCSYYSDVSEEFNKF